MMRGLALEGQASGILINAIMPTGATRMTERLPKSDYSDWLLHTMRPERMSVGAAFLLSEHCQIHGEMLSIGGGRVARIVLAETEGFVGSGATIEEVRDAMPEILADDRYFYPKDQNERATKVARIMGYEGSVGEDAYLVKDIPSGG